MLSGSGKYCRLLNFIFTADKVYWATDTAEQSKRWLFSVDRDINGVPDFSNIKEIYNFPYIAGGQATYTTAYIRDLNGILILDRKDDINSADDIPIRFYDITKDRMHTIGYAQNIDGAEINTDQMQSGFRCEAVNWYQGFNTNKIVCGFGYYKNNNEWLGNTLGSNKDRVCNLALEVIKIR